MTGYIVVLTFLSGIAGHPQQATVSCPTTACIERLLVYAHESRLLSRLRAWEPGRYAPLSVGEAVVWPPMIDEQFL